MQLDFCCTFLRSCTTTFYCTFYLPALPPAALLPHRLLHCCVHLFCSSATTTKRARSCLVYLPLTVFLPARIDSAVLPLPAGRYAPACTAACAVHRAVHTGCVGLHVFSPHHTWILTVLDAPFVTWFAAYRAATCHSTTVLLPLPPLLRSAFASRTATCTCRGFPAFLYARLPAFCACPHTVHRLPFPATVSALPLDYLPPTFTLPHRLCCSPGFVLYRSAWFYCCTCTTCLPACLSATVTWMHLDSIALPPAYHNYRSARLLQFSTTDALVLVLPAVLTISSAVHTAGSPAPALPAYTTVFCVLLRHRTCGSPLPFHAPACRYRSI